MSSFLIISYSVSTKEVGVPIPSLFQVLGVYTLAIILSLGRLSSAYINITPFSLILRSYLLSSSLIRPLATLR